LFSRHALVFACDGKPIGSPARTLRDFVTTLSRLPSIRSITMPRRGDFSPWIGEVFGDHPQDNAAWVAHAEG
jgi:hypothetical protein